MRIWLLVDKDGYVYPNGYLRHLGDKAEMDKMFSDYANDPDFEDCLPFRLVEFEEVKK